MRTADLDFRDILSFSPVGGAIRFLGQRTLLIDSSAQALMRKELIDLLGYTAARTVITRSAYAHGWRIAETVKNELPSVFGEAKQGVLGPLLCALHGFGVIKESRRTDGEGSEPLVQTSLLDSIEVEQHKLFFETSDEAVCWSFAGFASGYVSYVQGREVYFIEDKCCGKGDDCCRVVGRYLDKWGSEINEHLAYYQIKTVGATCEDISRRLAKAEKPLKDMSQEFGFLQDVNDNELVRVMAKSQNMQKTVEIALRIAKVDSTVVITGESGVGKERMAQLIHEKSARSCKPFLAVNCGAMTETLLDSELFGHARGAFTGADRDREGLFEAAAGGTLFLDEVGDISPGMQVKLLRALQEKQVRRVGENRSRPIDVRIISATNRNLQEDVAAGRFRQDLYYRLCVIQLHIPALRERTDDILPLARLFISNIAKTLGRDITGITYKAADILLSYGWPGNIRELQNVIEYAIVLSSSTKIDVDDLPSNVKYTKLNLVDSTRVRTLGEIEKDYIISVLNSMGNNKMRTAKRLDISLATLYRKLKEYGMMEAG
jgi:two-component system, NtrC family, response regulator HydG